MHSACVTALARIASSSCGRSARSSGKSRWQCESTNIQGVVDSVGDGRRPSDPSIVCVVRVDASDSPRILSIVVFALPPVSSCVNWTPMPCVRFPCTPSGVIQTTLPWTAILFGIVHQRQQHEHFLAERVGSRRRDEDAAAAQERHVRRIQRRPLADVERQHAGASGARAACRRGWSFVGHDQRNRVR